MKKIFGLLICAFLLSCNGQEVKQETKQAETSNPYDFAYQNGEDVVVQRNADKHELRLANANDPAISPDGLTIALTKSKDSGSEFIRYIVLANLESMAETRLHVASSNFYGATWSPNNALLAFNVYNGSNWQIGLIKPDNSGYQTIQAKPNTDLFAPTWSSDGKHIIAQNLNTIFIFDTNGQLVDSLNTATTLGADCYISSSSSFYFTQNENCIVFNCEINESMKDIEGPVEALFEYNRTTKELRRLTPKGMSAYDLSIVNDQSFVFVCIKEGETKTAIARIDVASKKIEILQNDGTRPKMRIQ